VRQPDLRRWQFDGHMVIPEGDVDGELVFRLHCPAGWHAPCRTAMVDGGAAHPSTVSGGCGLDGHWPDPLDVYTADGFDADTLADARSWTEIAWQVGPDGDGLIWAPRAWAEHLRQVAA
jgi:hypothetical protein